jgi:hypothetical protein
LYTIVSALRPKEKRETYGVYFIFKSMEQGRTFCITVPKYPAQDPNHRILAPQRSRFTHYYFYIRDEVLGPIIIRMASFFPSSATYWLNGHSFIEPELERAGVGFHKNDNALLGVDDVAALQAVPDQLSPVLIRKRLDYWTLLLGPNFSKKQRSQMNLSRFYAITQIEYCQNAGAAHCPSQVSRKQTHSRIRISDKRVKVCVSCLHDGPAFLRASSIVRASLPPGGYAGFLPPSPASYTKRKFRYLPLFSFPPRITSRR